MKNIEELNQYETCDRILAYAVKKPEKWHNPIEIRDKFLSSVAIEKVEYLFNLMATTQQPEPATFHMNFQHDFWEIKKNEFTEEFLNNGGFTRKYEEQLKQFEEEAQLKKLEKQKLKLETENLEYQKTIRDQEQRIRNLTEQNSFISLIKNYWWLLFFSAGIGYAIAQIVNSF